MSELLCDNNSVKTRVNRSDFFEKLGFQDEIFIKETIIFIPSKVLGDFKANKVRKHRQWLKNFEDTSELLCDNNSAKTRVNRSDFFVKLGFQDKIFSKDTILFIPSKVLGDFKANKVRKHRQWLKNFKDMSELLCDNNSVKTRVNRSDFFENTSLASSNFFSHWRCLPYFIHLEIP